MPTIIWVLSTGNQVSPGRRWVLIRKPYASISDEEQNELSIIFSIDYDEAIGKWNRLDFYGGADASEDIGTGMVVASLEDDREKTDLEGFLVTLTFRNIS